MDGNTEVAKATGKGIEHRPKGRDSFAKGFGSLKKKNSQHKIDADPSLPAQLASDISAATAGANDDMYDAPSHCTRKLDRPTWWLHSRK